MFRNPVTCQVASCATKRLVAPQAAPAVRHFATVSPVDAASRSHKVVVVGGGSAGLSVSHQLLRSGKFAKEDIAVVDPAEWHHYQPGWTLVGGGLKKKEDLRQPLAPMIDPKLKFYNHKVGTFTPEQNYITLDNGDKISYDQLVVVPGFHVDLTSIKGLPEALADPKAPVSTIYQYNYCDKAITTIEALRKGNAIFTQPTGIVKCAGAPQKVMWLAWDHWRRAGLYDSKNPAASPIHITFATGLPTMFGVPKYSAKLDELRRERGVEGLFQHDLVSIDGNTANFVRADGEKVARKFDLLHAVPKMGPHAFVKNSALADQAGYVDVDQETLRHKKFHNVWSIGDAAALPTSKTAAAITSQAPVMVSNLLRAIEGKEAEPAYDGYTSCPLTVGENKVLLAEFKYGGIPKETFGDMFGIDQATPRRAFYHLKKDFFPWVYNKYMVKGQWGGPKGWIR
ncbi:sulfide,quinone oxidoreductase/flavo-binding protein [Trematosphaeria pertusa]|uniref:Sulfide,quinone oxidoreductase/flavo-binding protein n=1 Tax=Trematosphaeria pertusa TaxID=390896 RepID=A0A6A6IK71_9PLEO|nr:sulfide,quinone oxidoreductase/flavo-binding protein [Trematosphaeria pertusa]KAF2250821.1 sulfide,quinone oxidoreductase/flavo-binding protein [Trematosphaeria pertusa]